MRLHVQRALLEGESLDALAERLSLSVRRHPDRPNLVLLKYSQIDSPMGDPIAQECRGVILDESDGWRLVSRTFGKFFNYGEGHAAPIDWATARVQEKLDGSLIQMYHYAGEWHVATSGTPDAGGEVHGWGRSFRDYFWQTFTGQGCRRPEARNLCFAFELTGPSNRVVVTYREPRVTLLAVRDRDTGEWLDERLWAQLIAVPAVRSFPLGSLDEIVASFAGISPLSQEGYVVVDAHGRRIKVKHPGYVALHHARSGMGPRAFLEIARAGEVSEVAAAFPEFAEVVNECKARIDALVAEVEADYARIRHHEVQKAFALEAVPTKLSGCLFALRSGKCTSVRQYIADMHIDRLEAIVGRVGEDVKVGEPIAEG